MWYAVYGLCYMYVSFTCNMYRSLDDTAISNVLEKHVILLKIQSFTNWQQIAHSVSIFVESNWPWDVAGSQIFHILSPWTHNNVNVVSTENNSALKDKYFVPQWLQSNELRCMYLRNRIIINMWHFSFHRSHYDWYEPC